MLRLGAEPGIPAQTVSVSGYSGPKTRSRTCSSAACWSRAPAASLISTVERAGLARTAGVSRYSTHRPALARVDQARTGARQSTTGQSRGLSREPAAGNLSPKILNDPLHEPPKTFGVSHKNPTSTRPGPPPQTSHGHDGIPRHTPALVLK